MEFLLTKIKENLNEQMLLLTISNPRKAEEVKKVQYSPDSCEGQTCFSECGVYKDAGFS